MKFVEQTGVLSPAECSKLLAYCDSAEFAPASMTVNGRSVVDPTLRKSRISFLPPDFPEVMKLHAAMRAANSSIFHIDITEYYRGELLLYAAELDENFNWHADDPLWLNRTPYRKLTGVCQLTDPSLYVGGALQLKDLDGRIVTPTRAAGSLVMFPSFYQHQVTKVTSGVRKTLVTFGLGPMWR